MSTEAVVSPARSHLVSFQPAEVAGEHSGGGIGTDIDVTAEDIRDTLEGAVVRFIDEVGESGHKRLLIITDPEGHISDSQQVHILSVWGSDSEFLQKLDELLENQELHYINQVGDWRYQYLILVTRPKTE